MTTPCLLNHASSPVYANPHFTVVPCSTCSLPGYLIVLPNRPVISLAHLTSEALAALGPTLALATRAIETVVQPERVYCALFAEQTRHIHFHLFPRTAWLAEQYAAAQPEQAELSGPRLLEWARGAFQRPIVEANRDGILERIRLFCREHGPDTTVQC